MKTINDSIDSNDVADVGTGSAVLDVIVTTINVCGLMSLAWLVWVAFAVLG